jgi:hypothetical protein
MAAPLTRILDPELFLWIRIGKVLDPTLKQVLNKKGYNRAVISCNFPHAYPPRMTSDVMTFVTVIYVEFMMALTNLMSVLSTMVFNGGQ